MRGLVAVLLVGLVIVCPLLCGASEAACGAHEHNASQDCPEEPARPAHCPQDQNNCICNGAVRADEARAFDLDVIGFIDLPALVHTPPHPISHLTWEGSPTGLAGWGDLLTVRALLQIFRC